MRGALCLSVVGILFLGGWSDALAAPSLVSGPKNHGVSRAGSLRIGGLHKKNVTNLGSATKLKSLDSATETASVSRAATTPRLGVGRFLGVQHQSVSMEALPNQLTDHLTTIDSNITDLQENKQNRLQIEQSEYLQFTDEDETVLDVNEEALISALRDGHEIVLSYDPSVGITWSYNGDNTVLGTISQDDLRSGILNNVDIQNDIITPLNGKMARVESGNAGEFIMADANGDAALSGYTFDDLVQAVADRINNN